MSQDDSLQKMLEDLGRAMAEAMTQSEDVGAVIRRLRADGFSLYLVLDRPRDEADSDDRRRAAREAVARIEQNLTEAPSLDDDAASRPISRKLSRPQYRLDSADTAFLRSIGIDPSRTGRRRRR
ncbi:MAG: hypothetical protein AAGN46_02385 [Acidobacteriota bacterium]